ncbi:MAG: hypothetical protein AAGG48_14940 [Planctomycetota bacterium]
MPEDDHASLYKQLAIECSFDPCVQSLVTGDMVLSDANPWIETAFPPAFIPMYSKAAGNMIGYWKHWNCSRSPTIVNFSGITNLGEPQIAYELATSFNQLKYVYFMNLLFATGLKIDEEIQADAEELAFDDFDALLAVCRKHGQRKSGLLDLEVFRENPPHACFKASPMSYPGSFPNPYSKKKQLTEACSYEIHSWFQEDEYEFRKRIANEWLVPKWLRVEEQRPVFDQMLNSGNITGAWMSLNSIGWNLEDAHQAIRELEPHIDDPRFSILTRAWRAIPREGQDYY